MDEKNKLIQKINKYKYKILQLGGHVCPKIGLENTYGSCWHNSLAMVLLYDDELSEKIQKVFDNENFDIDKIIDYAVKNTIVL